MSNLSDDTLHKVSSLSDRCGASSHPHYATSPVNHLIGYSLRSTFVPQILQQIQTQGLTAQKALAGVSAQLQVKAREKRILELTVQQLEGIKDGNGEEGEVKMYKGVGKMCVVVNPFGRPLADAPPGSIRSPRLTCRFMLAPRRTIAAEHASRTKSLSDDLVSLSKKAKYLEKQVQDANNQWRDIVHATTRQQAQEAGR